MRHGQSVRCAQSESFLVLCRMVLDFRAFWLFVDKWIKQFHIKVILYHFLI